MMVCSMWFQYIESFQAMLNKDDWRAKIKQGEIACSEKLKEFIKDPVPLNQNNQVKPPECLCLCCINNVCSQVENCQKIFFNKILTIGLSSLAGLIVVFIVACFIYRYIMGKKRAAKKEKKR
jgi:hypothetical protein